MTICEKCGAEREGIDCGCPACRFHPKTVRELATAALLTTQFEAGDESFGTNADSLAALARELRAGKQPNLNASELARHERTVEIFLQVKPSDVYWALFRFFLPAIVLLVVLLGILALIRFANR